MAPDLRRSQVGRVIVVVGLLCLVGGLLSLGPRSNPTTIAYLPFAGGAVVLLTGLAVQSWGQQAPAEGRGSESESTVAARPRRLSRPALCWVSGVVISSVGLAGAAAGTWGAASLQHDGPHWPVLAWSGVVALAGAALQAAAGVAFLVVRRAVDRGAVSKVYVPLLALAVTLVYSNR